MINIIRNPAVLFVVMWLFAIFLNSLKLSSFQSEFGTNTIIALYGSICTFLFGWLFGGLIFGKTKLKTISALPQSEATFYLKACNFLLIVGLACFLLKVKLVGYVPMLAANKTEAYNQFNFGGPPVISIFFQIIGYLGLIRLIVKLNANYKIKIYDAIPFLLEIVIDSLRGSRGPIVTNFILLFILLVLHNKIKIKYVVIPFLILYFFIITMGVIRIDNFSDFVRIQGGIDISDSWYDPYWVWPYIYIAMSVENVDYFLKYTTSFAHGTNSFYAIISIFMLKRLLGLNLDLAVDSDSGNYISSFNVGTYLDPFIKDFGLYGCLIMPFFLGLWVYLFYRKRYHSVIWYFGYLLTISSSLFCFFYNEFWSVKNIFTLLLLIAIFNFRKVIKNI